MTIDTNIPLWGLITVCGVLFVRLLQRYCVELAEGFLKWASMVATMGLPRDAKVLWHREVLFHALEEIAHDLAVGRVRGEVAWRATWNAANLLLGAPSLRSETRGAPSLANAPTTCVRPHRHARSVSTRDGCR